MSIFFWEGWSIRRALIFFFWEGWRAFFSGKGGALGKYFLLGGVEH